MAAMIALRWSIIVLTVLCTVGAAHATHNRSGHISYKHISGLTYQVTVTTYTVPDAPAERPWLLLSYGDGTVDTVHRSNGGGQGEIIFPGMKRNRYIGIHTYPSASTYIICMSDPNRKGGVINVPNSINVPFSISAELWINPVIGANSSVEIAAPPIHIATVGQPFRQNLAAYDEDGDELLYELVDCTGESCGEIPDYSIPDGVTLNPENGDFVWENPTMVGEFNFAIRVRECRGGVVIASTVIDFQVAVLPTGQMPIFSVPDSWETSPTGSHTVHMQPNGTVSFDVVLTDVPTPALEIHADPEVAGAMTLEPDSLGENYLRSTFTWTPQSARCTPYLLVFRGRDNTAIDHSLLVYVHEDGMQCPSQCVPTSIGTVDDASSHVSVYPNPTDGVARVKITDSHTYSQLSLELIGMDGRAVSVPLQIMSSDEAEGDIRKVASGVYTYRIMKDGIPCCSGRIILR